MKIHGVRTRPAVPQRQPDEPAVTRLPFDPERDRSLKW